MKTPESDKFAALVRELEQVVNRLQQFAATEATERNEAAVLSVCDALADAQHRARRTLRLMELNNG